MRRISKSLKKDNSRKSQSQSQQQNHCQHLDEVRKPDDKLRSSSDVLPPASPTQTMTAPSTKATKLGKNITGGASIVCGESDTITSIDHMNLPAMPSNKVTSLHQLVQIRDWDILRKRLCSTNPSRKDKTIKSKIKQGNGAKSFLRTKNKRLSFDDASDENTHSNILSCQADPSHIASVYSYMRPIKASHCITRDDRGRTPLHLVLLRFTHGTLLEKNLCLRRAPSDVVIKLIQHEPLACSIPDADGILPLHYAAREGHGIKVIRLIVDSYQGAVSERDPVEGKDAIEYAIEYVCGTFQSNLITTAIGDDYEAGTQKGGQGDDQGNDGEVNEKRWEVVRSLLHATEGNNAPPSFSLPVLNGCGSFTEPNPPLILKLLANSAPESVIRLLLPSSEPIFASRHGLTFACTALYVAIARKYSFGFIKELTDICPGRARVVRDETGMGLVSASYIAWAYEQRDDGEWRGVNSSLDALESVIKAKTLETIKNSDFRAWWEQMVFWILFCRRDVGIVNGTKKEIWKSLEHPPLVPMPNTPRIPCTYEHPSLLHAAVSNPDTPIAILKVLLALYASSCEQFLVCGSNLLLPLHIACMTPECTPRHYELQPHQELATCNKSRNTCVVEMLLSEYPRGGKLTTGEGTLALHLALWVGRRTWSEGVRSLVATEPRALRIKDDQGFYPYQLAAISREYPTDIQVRFVHIARNSHSHKTWRAMTAEERSKSVLAVQKKQELAELETVFELFKADPSLIEDGITHDEIKENITVSMPMIDLDDGTINENKVEIHSIISGSDVDHDKTQNISRLLTETCSGSEKIDISAPHHVRKVF